MDVQTNNTDRRRRKSAPARRVPVVIDEPERKPFAFGWGADLNHREREALKERIALFAGLGLALVVVLALGYGWYRDNIYNPAQVTKQNNTPIAQVGSYTVRMGFFKRFETFQQNQANSSLSQIQQELSSLQATKSSQTKYAAQIAQLQSQQSNIQQQLAALPSQSLSTLIDDQVILQRSQTGGVMNTPMVTQSAMTQLEHQAGGRRHLATFIQQSGLSNAEISMLVTADSLRTKLQKKLATGVGHIQTKVRASHILFLPKDHSLALKVLKQVEAGANFAALARKYSKDPGSAKKGGDLGYFAKGSMVPQFDKAAFSMHVGQIRLVKSQYGWHIIKVTGRENARLSSAEYQQAQQTAFTSWLNTQQSLLHVQRFISPANLPNPVNTSTTGVNGLPAQQPGQIPGQVQGQVPSGQQVPAVSGKASTGKAKKK